MPSLPAFPRPALPAWLADALALTHEEVTVHAASDEDLPFLRALYAQSREAELAPMPWPDAVRLAFCDSQFDLQHRHYVTQYPSAAYLVVRRHDAPIGRLYLHWSPRELRIVDILLERASQGHGIGSTLLRNLQRAVCQATLPMLSLHVERHNRHAHRLYRRLGFADEGSQGGHLRMEWRPRLDPLS